MYKSSTNEFIHVITEQYFKDPWLSLSSHYGEDGTRGGSPRRGVSGSTAYCFHAIPRCCFQLSYQALHSSPLIFFYSPSAQTLIGHSEEKRRVVKINRNASKNDKLQSDGEDYVGNEVITSLSHSLLSLKFPFPFSVRASKTSSDVASFPSASCFAKQ